MTTLIDLPGKHGRQAEAYIESAIELGTRALAQLAETAVARFIAAGRGGVLLTSHLFNAEEIERLIEVLAATIGTADLLGASAIWQQFTLVAAANGDVPRVSESAVHQLNRLFVSWLREDAFVEPMPPDAALQYFRSLTPALGVDPQRWGADLRRRVFTMAAATDTGLLSRVQGIITDRLQTGVGISTAAADIQDVLTAAGVTTRNPQYSEMVMRTNVVDAHNQARTQAMQDPDVSAMFPVWQYVGVNDSRSRRTDEDGNHVSFHDKYYPNSVPFVMVRDSIQTSPWNCRCSQRAISKFAWNKLKAAGARIADGYPDVPSTDELAGPEQPEPAQAEQQPPVPIKAFYYHPELTRKYRVGFEGGYAEPVQAAGANPFAPEPAQAEPITLQGPTGRNEVQLAIKPDAVQVAVVGSDGVASIAVVKPGDTFAGVPYDELRAMGNGRHTMPTNRPASQPLQIAGPTAIQELQAIRDAFKDLSYQEITDRVTATLSGLKAADAIQAAVELGIVGATGRLDAIRKISFRIRDAKESWDRVKDIGMNPPKAKPPREGQLPLQDVNWHGVDSTRVELTVTADAVSVDLVFPPDSPKIVVKPGGTFLGWTFEELQALGDGMKFLTKKGMGETTPPTGTGVPVQPTIVVDNPPNVEALSPVDAVIADKTFLAKVAGLPRAAVKKAVSVAAGIYDKAEKKYGSKWAKAILATAIIGLPIPGGTAAVLAMTGLAALHARLRPATPTTAAHESAVAEMTQEEIEQAAADLIAELQDALAVVAEIL